MVSCQGPGNHCCRRGDTTNDGFLRPQLSPDPSWPCRGCCSEETGGPAKKTSNFSFSLCLRVKVFIVFSSSKIILFRSESQRLGLLASKLGLKGKWLLEILLGKDKKHLKSQELILCLQPL